MNPTSKLLLVAPALLTSALAAHAASPPGDHYLCYRAVKRTAIPQTTKMLEDQLGGPDPFYVQRVVSLCNPVDKNGEGIAFPQVHEEGYRIKAPRGAPKFVREDHVTVDQFARRRLTIVRPDSLLDVTPKALGALPPAPFVTDPTLDPAVNRFKCYRARLARRSAKFTPPPSPVLTDQFFTGGQSFQVRKVTKLCMPVDKDAETPGAELRPTHLVCYAVKLPRGVRFMPREVSTNSSNFGAHLLRATAPSELCVPAFKDPPPTSISLASSAGGGHLVARNPRGVGCGSVLPGPAPNRLAGNPSSMLDCQGLNIGGGTSPLPEVLVADGAYSRFDLTGCNSAGMCSIVGTPAGGLNPGEQCSQTGCAFGVPQPLENGSASTCVTATLANDASGTIDLNSGAIDLTLNLLWHVSYTGNPTSPCPTCSASGTPQSPGTGICVGGTNSGGGCLSTSSTGLSVDCPPPNASNFNCLAAALPFACCTGVAMGACSIDTIAVDLAPLTTGVSSKADPLGDLCAGQSGAATSGCFGAAGTSCTSVVETGTPAGPLAVGTPANVELGAVFCVPSSSSSANGAFGLPGPGAVRASYTITPN